jgi:hypothetical protein
VFDNGAYRVTLDYFFSQAPRRRSRSSRSIAVAPADEVAAAETSHWLLSI